jgi:hypothetical protein
MEMQTFPSVWTKIERNSAKLNGNKMSDSKIIPFGCHIGLKNVITGGELGKSFGNSSLQLKNPPSYNVSGGPIIINSHLNIFSSSPSPTDTPSGGFFANSKKNAPTIFLTIKYFDEIFSHPRTVAEVIPTRNSKTSKWYDG